MLTYFMRRIFGAAVKLCVLSFILFYMVLELPGGPRNRINIIHPNPPPEHQQFMERNLHIDKPWPLNYIDWLFDPYALKLSNGKVNTQASGALTGDFGQSIWVDYGLPLTLRFGSGIGELLAFLTTLIAALMALVAAQRWRRPQPYRVSTLPTTSSLVNWWHLHSRSPIDVAIMDRQWA